MKITKDTFIADALSTGNAQAVAMALKNFGMNCFGCALAKGETIEQAAATHGVDLEMMLAALNAASES